MACNGQFTWTGASPNQSGMVEARVGARPLNGCIRTKWNVDGDGGWADWQPWPSRAASLVKYQHCQVENRTHTRERLLLSGTASTLGVSAVQGLCRTVCLSAILFLFFYRLYRSSHLKTLYIIGLQLGGACHPGEQVQNTTAPQSFYRSYFGYRLLTWVMSEITFCAAVFLGTVEFTRCRSWYRLTNQKFSIVI